MGSAPLPFPLMIRQRVFPAIVGDIERKIGSFGKSGGGYGYSDSREKMVRASVPKWS